MFVLCLQCPRNLIENEKKSFKHQILNVLDYIRKWQKVTVNYEKTSTCTVLIFTSFANITQEDYSVTVNG